MRKKANEAFSTEYDFYGMVMIIEYLSNFIWVLAGRYRTTIRTSFMPPTSDQNKMVTRTIFIISKFISFLTMFLMKKTTTTKNLWTNGWLIFVKYYGRKLQNLIGKKQKIRPISEIWWIQGYFQLPMVAGKWPLMTSTILTLVALSKFQKMTA